MRSDDKSSGRTFAEKREGGGRAVAENPRQETGNDISHCARRREEEGKTEPGAGVGRLRLSSTNSIVL